MSRCAAVIIWFVAAVFLAVCIGDTFTGTPAAWGLIGWAIPVMTFMGYVLWKTP